MNLIVLGQVSKKNEMLFSRRIFHRLVYLWIDGSGSWRKNLKNELEFLRFHEKKRGREKLYFRNKWKSEKPADAT